MCECGNWPSMTGDVWCGPLSVLLVCFDDGASCVQALRQTERFVLRTDADVWTGAYPLSPTLSALFFCSLCSLVWVEVQRVWRVSYVLLPVFLPNI